MTSLIMMRHAPTLWNAQGRIQGQTDTALSPEGRAMVQRWTVPAAWKTREVITSPLQRTRETAALLGLEIAATETRLMETDWGNWAGRTLEDLRREGGKTMERNEAAGLDFRPEGGESPREVAARLQAFLNETAKAGNDLLVVTHRGVMRAALVLATGWDMTGKEPLKLPRDGALMLTLGPDGTVRLDAPPLCRLGEP